MTCYEKILESLPFTLNESIKDDYVLSDDTSTRVNKLGTNECEGLCWLVGVDYDGTQNWESFINSYLNGIDKPKTDKRLKELSNNNMWDRWERGGRISKKELSLIICKSVDVIEKYCRKSQAVYLKSYSNGDYSNVYFKKEDWLEYEVFLER